MFNISIVTYTHDINDLKKCVESIFIQKELVQLIIVDNLRSHIVKDYVTKLSNVLYFELPNPGFGAAHNFANNYFKFSGHRVFLNPDIEMSPLCLTRLRTFFEEKQGYSLVSPLLSNYDGSMQRIIREYPSIFKLIKRNLSSNYLEDTEPNFVDGVCSAELLHGAFFVINKRIPENFQCYDTRFFMYLEDFDLCIALQDFGKIGIVQDASAIHRHNRGSRKNIKLFTLHLLSFIKFWNKHGYFYER